jgi:class 3 adenylate cyclase
MRGSVGFSLFLLLLLSLFSLLLNGEWQQQNTIERNKWLAEITDQVQQRCEILKRSLGWRIPLQQALKEYTEQAHQICVQYDAATARDKLETLYETTMRPLFPPHDLLFFHVSTGSINLWQTKKNLQAFSSEEYQTIIAGIQTESVATATNLFMDQRFSDVLDFPMRLASLLEVRRINRLRVFVSDRHLRGFFFGNVTSLRGTQGFGTVALLDLDKMSGSFGIKRALLTLADQKSGLMVLDSSRRRSLGASAYVANNPDCRRRLAELLRNNRERPLSLEFSGNYVFCFRRIPHLRDLEAVWIFPLPTRFRAAHPTTALAFAGSLLIVFLGFVLCVETLVFQRGRRLNVGTTLILMLLLVTGLPVAGLYIFSRRTVEEYDNKARSRMFRDLEETLTRIDNGIQFKMANMIQQFRWCRRNDSLGRALYREEARGVSASDSTLLHALTPKIGLRLKSDMNDVVLAGLIGIIGPDGFRRFWAPSSQNAEQRDGLEKLTGPLMRSNLEKMNPELGKQRNSGNRPQIQKDDLVREGLFDFMRLLFSPEGVIRTLFYPEAVQRYAVNTGTSYSLQIPITVNQAVRYMMVIFWLESVVTEPYLREILSGPNTSASSPHQIFVASNYMKASWESIPAGIASIPHLKDISTRVKTTKAAIRAQYPEQGVLVQGRPSLFSPRMILLGQTATRPIRQAIRRAWTAFQAGIALELIIAVLAALAGARYFMKPMSSILSGIREIDAQRYGVRLDAKRGDEFGLLASAFNKMARGLEEGQILGTYVSSWVKRAMADETFREEAKHGRTTNVTILFSGLFEFDEFQKAKKPKEVFRILEMHLNAASQAITAHGGDIDKVIGDKILLVFDHEILGGGQKAAAAALAVTAQIRRELKTRECPLEPLMGLNSGSAISGILGAENIRQDFTVIGDTVNLAARLATLAHITGGTRVVLSGSSRGLLSRSVLVEKLPFKRVKGKTRQVQAFLLLENQPPRPEPVEASGISPTGTTSTTPDSP